MQELVRRSKAAAVKAADDSDQREKCLRSGRVASYMRVLVASPIEPQQAKVLDTSSVIVQSETTLVAVQ